METILNSSRGSSGTSSSSTAFNHGVSRSNELLSCAKTAWKIREREQSKLRQQQQQQQGNHGAAPPPPPNNPTLRLASLGGPPPASLAVLDDGFTLLRAMEYGAKKLQALVRRRGHTNDPTQEITSLVKQLEQDFKELTSYCDEQLLRGPTTAAMVRRRRSKQEQRHWELVTHWFQRVANHHSGQLQDCLKLRGEILAEQAQKHRKLVENKQHKTKASSKGAKNTGTRTAAASMSATATPLFDSPLFTATSSASSMRKTTANANANANAAATKGNGNGNLDSSMKQQKQQQQASGRKARPTATNGSSSNYYRGNMSTPGGAVGVGVGVVNGGYGAAYGGRNASSGGYTAGYGGGGYGSSGMRQRKGGTNNNYSSSSSLPEEEQEEEQKVHSQIQMRERKRQTRQRLDEARQAESTLSEVATLYSKMSTLITQQGETLEKIEDDVECALVDVSAGQEELTKLYAIKKGNRPLIIKIFLILNFLIVFMRAYRDR
uniref:t-SNARE coiled-coil homology domain-containing protein n=1 Tax=Pseudo-nitzschia australis TaxID=44445 RepID=A0A7S4ALS4_9STRA|mmetsp:Transcript_25840/g.56655  ORF Transcript_25840/g.56655 Transcript_25840/m.56655 type:complete len:492 (-) Transcript_25840:53-1528(-)|eukprot:CAMPEP_0168179024 /NCGR_PEP_ID=MMETSP0139_2-20121125/9554_1 /TAXON_ID=44445 /ORGANISM="Pseudo-nitzschia australis, Strain 10249 10 AB" /LENGTH=491 /DNA_ID=CAMNT_0008098689 /DNA_START=162 /DNA_END=1637 /DNA_ORIENTATION=-